MICEKCGLDIRNPEVTCPRCGNALPIGHKIRTGMEAGSVDSWAGEQLKEQEITQTEWEEFRTEHPSVIGLMVAIAIRVVFYIIAIIVSLIAQTHPWRGLLLLVNALTALIVICLMDVYDEPTEKHISKTICLGILWTDLGLSGLIVVLSVVNWVLSLFA